MEDIADFYRELADEALQYEDIGYKSKKIRAFVIQLSNTLKETKLVEFAVYNAFQSEFPSIEVNKNYFHTVCSRGFKTFTDQSDRTWIDAKYPKYIRDRKRKS